MNGTSKVCHLYVFLVNNMKLRKKNQTGEKKSVLKKNQEATKIKILENPTDKSLILSKRNFCQLRFLIRAFLWPGNFF